MWAQFGNVILDRQRRRIRHRGVDAKLTPIEFKIAWELLGRCGTPVPRAYLQKLIAGRSQETRTLDVHVFRLKSKLETVSNYQLTIKAIYGVGYQTCCRKASGAQ
ncbi:winged helix-turn-helix domain-containing protein [Caballeronia sp. Lep1P3]